VRIDGLLRIPGLPELARGDRIQLAVIRIDELMQEIELRCVGVLGHVDAAEDEETEAETTGEAGGQAS
uniref:hypothetical protein n=1 Tax=Chromobacterium haemolyticum TaxID=394935 RepID=UPI0013B398D9